MIPGALLEKHPLQGPEIKVPTLYQGRIPDKKLLNHHLYQLSEDLFVPGIPNIQYQIPDESILLILYQ